MARVNVYVPDDLAERAREAGLNVSGLTQEAIRRALGALDTDRWLDALQSEPPAGVDHRAVAEAVRAAKDEWEQGA